MTKEELIIENWDLVRQRDAVFQVSQYWKQLWIDQFKKQLPADASPEVLEKAIAEADKGCMDLLKEHREKAKQEYANAFKKK